jgi:hypothetical protein
MLDRPRLHQGCRRGIGEERVTTKREARRQRSEFERQLRERREQARKLRSRVLLVVGALAVLTAAALTMRRQSDNAGRVWSAEHGHWHEK